MKHVLSCMMILTAMLVASVSEANTEAAQERLVKHYVEPGRVKAKWMDGTFQISVRSMPMSSRLFLMSVCRTAALEYYLNKFSVELRRIGSDKIEAARQCR
jgi:UV DNA damage repair endonuclease